MTTNVRKIQKSKTGYYINLPKAFVENLIKNNKEFAKVSFDKDSTTIIIDFIEM